MNINDYIVDKYKVDGTKKIVEILGINRENLAQLFGELGYKKGAEIGTLRGQYAETLCKNIPGLSLMCVDPYQAYQVYVRWHTQRELDEAYQIAQARVKGFDVTFVKDFSVEVAKTIPDESLDFVYIDASHTYRDVVDDVDSWYRKVRRGGIVSGHDYLRRVKPTNTHIIQAVNGFIDSYSIAPLFLTDRPAELKGKVRDESRSWFFVKV